MSATNTATPVSERAHGIGSQFFRYLCVGCFNTLFGYATYAISLLQLSRHLPQHYLYLTVVLASALALPINITVAYFGYKVFVFRTQGNYLREWLKAFAVYSVGAIPVILGLSALTRVLQTTLPTHSYIWMDHSITMKSLAGYIAGVIVTGVQTIYSFFAHRQITFRPKPS